jgi:hypothetical protein
MRRGPGALLKRRRLRDATKTSAFSDRSQNSHHNHRPVRTALQRRMPSPRRGHALQRGPKTQLSHREIYLTRQVSRRRGLGLWLDRHPDAVAASGEGGAPSPVTAGGTDDDQDLVALTRL